MVGGLRFGMGSFLSLAIPRQKYASSGWSAFSIFRADTADKLEFCKSRYEETIIDHCVLFQSAHSSFSTSIVELHVSNGSNEA